MYLLLPQFVLIQHSKQWFDGNTYVKYFAIEFDIFQIQIYIWWNISNSIAQYCSYFSPSDNCWNAVLKQIVAITSTCIYVIRALSHVLVIAIICFNTASKQWSDGNKCVKVFCNWIWYILSDIHLLFTKTESQPFTRGVWRQSPARL